jgi:rhamnulokinase
MTTVRAVAIDLGASTGRIVSGHYDRSGLQLREIHRFPTPAYRDADTGHSCWDLDLIEAQVVHGLRLAAAEAPVQSVGIDSWGVDYVLLDRERNRVAPAVCYRDHRTDGELPRVLERMPAGEIYRRTGIQFLPLNTLVQLASCRRTRPEWLERTHSFLMLPDYLHFRLCGVLANEYTNATTTQMFGLGQDDWDPELLALAGLQPARMLTPVEPGTVLAEIERPFGAGQRVAVIAPATHDTASAVAAIPFEAPEEAFISSGTWSLVGFESARPFTGAAARRLNFTNEGGVERRYRVLKNIIGLWPAQCLAREHGLGHGELVDAAALAAPWGALIDPEDARFLNPASMTEAIRDLCRETGQQVPASPGALARCVFESLALTYARTVEEIGVLRGSPVAQLRIVGGGSRNRLLNQLCADACGIPVQAGPVETSAIGNACVQLIALGVFRSLSEARELIRHSYPAEAFRPAAPVPQEAVGRFRALAPCPPLGETQP